MRRPALPRTQITNRSNQSKGTEVRRLAGGGTGIRTLGPPLSRRLFSPLRHFPFRRKARLVSARGTGGSNPLPSSGESVANRFLPRGSRTGDGEPHGVHRDQSLHTGRCAAL